MENSMHNKNMGRWGENLATDFLINEGFQILERNYKRKGGEIDVIAVKDDTIHFIEVKTRSSAKYGHPLEAISRRKLEHMSRAAQLYMLENNIINTKAMCLDAISVLGKEINFVEGIYL